MALMAVAMMTPASLPAARHVAFNTLRRRRIRSLFFYEAGYLALFLGFSAAALFVATASAPASSGRWAPVVVLAAAAVWQLTNWKRRIALGCRRTLPLPPTGARADVACVRFGLLQASTCLGSTWLLMILMVFAGPWHLPAMAALTAIMILEERPAAARRIVKPLAVVLFALAAGVVLAG
jgi:predicted metal-binding membrane protein